MKYLSKSDEDTKQFAKNLAEKFSGGVIALSGDLGAGKTTFTQGFAEGLGIKDKIISPTFVLIRQHPIFSSKGRSASGRQKTLPAKKQTLFHIDLYRLEKINFKETGIQEIIDNEENIVLIEWAEKARDQLPKNTVWIEFITKNETTREIFVSS